MSAMTVGELMEALRGQPPEHVVVVEAPNSDPDPEAATLCHYRVANIKWRTNQTVLGVEEA